MGRQAFNDSQMDGNGPETEASLGSKLFTTSHLKRLIFGVARYSISLTTLWDTLLLFFFHKISLHTISVQLSSL